MDLSFSTLLMSFVAGFLSLASPCVLPVVPIIITGAPGDHKLRPVFIVGGLSVAFISMGVLMSIFGGLIGPSIIYLEKITGALVILFGVLMILDVNVFKKITIFNRLQGQGRKRGLVSGAVLGLTLGLVWIPCIGPMLSAVLAKVATEGQLSGGIILLSVYSVGFAIPMLLAAYASQWFRNSSGLLKKNPAVVRWVSGSILILFGLFILKEGVLGFAA